ncbi:hypothetical protein ACFLRC_00925 [Candidatus Altiarchaeota archaeon]
MGSAQSGGGGKQKPPLDHDALKKITPKPLSAEKVDAEFLRKHIIGKPNLSFAEWLGDDPDKAMGKLRTAFRFGEEETEPKSEDTKAREFLGKAFEVLEIQSMKRRGVSLGRPISNKVRGIGWKIRQLSEQISRLGDIDLTRVSEDTRRESISLMLSTLLRGSSTNDKQISALYGLLNNIGCLSKPQFDRFKQHVVDECNKTKYLKDSSDIGYYGGCAYAGAMLAPQKVTDHLIDELTETRLREEYRWQVATALRRSVSNLTRTKAYPDKRERFGDIPEEGLAVVNKLLGLYKHPDKVVRGMAGFALSRTLMRYDNMSNCVPTIGIVDPETINPPEFVKAMEKGAVFPLSEIAVRDSTIMPADDKEEIMFGGKKILSIGEIRRELKKAGVSDENLVVTFQRCPGLWYRGHQPEFPDIRDPYHPDAPFRYAMQGSVASFKSLRGIHQRTHRGWTTFKRDSEPNTVSIKGLGMPEIPLPPEEAKEYLEDGLLSVYYHIPVEQKAKDEVDSRALGGMLRRKDASSGITIARQLTGALGEGMVSQDPTLSYTVSKPGSVGNMFLRDTCLVKPLAIAFGIERRENKVQEKIGEIEGKGGEVERSFARIFDSEELETEQKASTVLEELLGKRLNRQLGFDLVFTGLHTGMRLVGIPDSEIDESVFYYYSSATNTRARTLGDVRTKPHDWRNFFRQAGLLLTQHPETTAPIVKQLDDNKRIPLEEGCLRVGLMSARIIATRIHLLHDSMKKLGSRPWRNTFHSIHHSDNISPTTAFDNTIVNDIPDLEASEREEYKKKYRSIDFTEALKVLRGISGDLNLDDAGKKRVLDEFVTTLAQ